MNLSEKSEGYLKKVHLFRFEIYFGQKSDFNFCVTSAMKNDLSNYGIK